MSMGIEIQEENTETSDGIQFSYPSKLHREGNGKPNSKTTLSDHQQATSTMHSNEPIASTSFCRMPIKTAMISYKIINHGILISSTSDVTILHSMNQNKMFFHVHNARKLTETLSLYPEMEQQYCGLKVAKLCIETLRCFKHIKNNIQTSLTTLLSISKFDDFDIESESNYQQFFSQLSSTVQEQITDTEDLQARCKNTFLQLVELHSFKKLMLKHGEKNIGLQFVVVYRKAIITIQSLVSTILSNHLKMSSNAHITPIVYLCKVLKNKMVEIIDLLYTHFHKRTYFYPNKVYAEKSFYKISYDFVALPPSIAKGFIPDRNTCIDNVSNYVEEIARSKSYSLACRLSDITLKTLKETAPPNLFTSNKEQSDDEGTLSNYFNMNLRSILKHLKTLYKQLLQDQKMYLSKLVQKIEENNNKILQGNTKALYRNSFHKHSYNSEHVKVLSWNTSLGPAQKDYLFNVFMGVLWSGVKQVIDKCYIASVFSNLHSEYRLNKTTWIQYEQELLWQMQLKFDKSGK